MSMMHCSGCDGILDTDYDLDGLWETDMPWRWWCTRCVASLHNEEMLLILKKQEPERYKEMME